jgi:hypothetical protein
MIESSRMVYPGRPYRCDRTQSVAKRTTARIHKKSCVPGIGKK